MGTSYTARLIVCLFAGAALLWSDLARRQAVLGTAKAVWAAPAKNASVAELTLLGQGNIPMPEKTPAAHASTMLAMGSAHPSVVMTFWFSGSRESGPDVQIAASHFDRATQRWSPARFVLNRQELGEQLGFGVRRLGNPVAWRDAEGRIHLFVVATGLGGWAAGRIVHLQSQKNPVFESLKFESPRLLPLSWLWNTSHLVRGGALGLEDGGMVLPVYFELGKKYPLALRFDDQGGLLGMERMSSRGDVLQPSLLMRSEFNWLALLRDNSPGKKLKVVQTLDGGQSWTDLPDLPLNNPDASVATLSLAPKQLFMAHNSQPHDRTVLDLSLSEDGLSWQKVSTLATGAGKDEFSYPSLVWADNSLWVSYTEQRRTIAWKRFAIKEGSP